MITPAKVYPGEKNHRFTITFTAPGPMDGGATLSIDNSSRGLSGHADLSDADGFETATWNNVIIVLGRGGAILVEVTDAADINPTAVY